MGRYRGRQRTIHRVLNRLTIMSLVFFPLFCVLIMDHFNFGASWMAHKRFMKLHPMPFLYEHLLVGVLFVVCLLLLRKAVIAAAVIGTGTFLCAYVNYIKIAVNGDPFYPRDLGMLKNVGELVSFVSGGVPFRFFAALLFFAAWLYMLAYYHVTIPGRREVHCLAAGSLAVLLLMPVASKEYADWILGKFHMSFQDTFLQSSNYKANGFIGAFCINLLNMHVTPPAGYSQELLEKQLSGYEATPQTGEDFDIIVVLSESFFDLRELEGIDFSENPLQNYDSIRQSEHCFWGTMYTTAVCGGTVRPEFDILTGLTTDYLTSGSSPWEYAGQSFATYVSNYKEAGYRTIALHPYDKKFYARNRAYPLIGFNTYYGLDEVSKVVDVSTKRGYATDASAFAALQHYLEEDQEPTFAFLITMQNHQPYIPITEGKQAVGVHSENLSPEVLAAVNTYAQGLYDADSMLGELREYIDKREKPTVLLFFGDHKPTLGPNFAAYEQTNYFCAADGLTQEELLRVFSTPFLIYSNRNLNSSFFSTHTENGVSSYQLLNAVAVMTGFKRTPYMNMLLDFYEAMPVYNTRLELPIIEAAAPFIQAQQYISYDRLLGKGYSN